MGKSFQPEVFCSVRPSISILRILICGGDGGGRDYKDLCLILCQSVEIKNGDDTLLLEDNYFDMNPGCRSIRVLEGELKICRYAAYMISGKTVTWHIVTPSQNEHKQTRNTN